jgi:trimethylamine--corrinoid protein Co-methyltransferase
VKGIPCRQMVRVLTDEEVNLIHEASLRILDRTGVRFDSEDARRRLVEAGAIPHPVKKAVLTFPQDVVESAIESTPREITCHARDPKWSLRYNGERTYPYAGGGDPVTIDIFTGEVRPSTYTDVENAARLGDALDNSHLSSHLVIANDVPPEMIELKTMEAAMRNSGKVMAHHATSAEVVEYMVRIWSLVAGGEEEFRKKPLLSLASSPSSPLTYPNHVCEVLIRSAELGVPFSVIPCPIAGGTGPVTLGGSLALQNAEALAGIVLIQNVAPSLPSVYCGRICFMDMTYGRELWGVPEVPLVSAAMVQLAKKYRMVSDSCGTASDVSRCDFQMGLERMMVSLVPVLAGTEGVSGMGDAWETVSCLEMMVIDNDIYDKIAEFMGRVPREDCVLDTRLSDAVIHAEDSSPRQRSPDRSHPLEPLMTLIREEASSEDSSDRTRPRMTLDAARDRAKRILKDHVPTPLDRDVEHDIALVMKEAQKALCG